jgi:hypothetical protein
MAHRLVLWVVEAAHLMPMVALKEVRVYIQSARNTTMTECLLDIRRVRSNPMTEDLALAASTGRGLWYMYRY